MKLRTALIAPVAVIVVAGSLLLGAGPATARSHVRWAFEGGDAMMLNGHRHSVSIAPRDTRVVRVFPGDQTAYTSYQLTVRSRNGSVVLRTVAGAYRTQFLLSLLTAGPDETTRPGPLVSGWQHYTTASMNRTVAWARALPLKLAWAKDRSASWERAREDEGQYSVAGDVYDSITAWRKAHPRRPLAEYPHALIGTCKEWRYEVTGTADRVTVRAFVPTYPKIWVALSNRRIDGRIGPAPSASADSYSSIGYARWVRRENATILPPVVHTGGLGDCPA